MLLLKILNCFKSEVFTGKLVLIILPVIPVLPGNKVFPIAFHPAKKRNPYPEKG